MKNALAAAAALMIICSSGSVFAALPPSVFTSQRPPAHIASSHRVHVNPSHRMHTPTGNRVRMTPTHGQNGPVGGRMASIHHGHHHGGPRHDRVYVRPSLPPYRYHRRYLRHAGGMPVITEAATGGRTEVTSLRTP